MNDGLQKRGRRLCCAVVAAIVGCSSADSTQQQLDAGANNDTFTVITTCYSAFEIADHLAGSAAEVTYVVPDSEDPHAWSPSASTISQLQTADLILLHGAGFEVWQDKVSLPSTRTIVLSSTWGDQLIAVPKSFSHQHGPRGATDNVEYAWATWLSPALLRKQIELISRELAARIPGRSSEIQSRSTKLIHEVDQLSSELAGLLDDHISGQTVTIFVDDPNLLYLTSAMQSSSTHTVYSVEMAQAEEVTKHSSDASITERQLLLTTGDHSDHDGLTTSSATARIDLCDRPNAQSSMLKRMRLNYKQMTQLLAE